jgi:2-aminoadipate transaminase
VSHDVGTRSWQQLFSAKCAPGGGEISSFMGDADRADLIAFTGGFPDPQTFPVADLRDLVDAVLADPVAMQYGPTGGLPGLRDWFAQWLGRHDGRRPAEDELMITSGGMEGLTLLNQCLLDPGDRALVEGPTFLGSILSIRHARGQVEAVPTDEDGLDVAALERMLERPGSRPVKFVYVIPDYQNPTGRSLSTERRHALVELARRHGVLVVEDVAYRELGFDDERRPSLRAIGPDVVVQLGTFAKTFFPGMRLGWIAGPAPLVTQVVRAKQYTDQCAAAFGQRLLEDYGRSGAFDRGIAASRAFYRRRSEIMLAALDAYLPPGVRFTRPAGGFFTWLTAPPSVDTGALLRQAAAEGVNYLPGSVFYADGQGANELRLAYSKVPDDTIGEGVRRLAKVLQTAL